MSFLTVTLGIGYPSNAENLEIHRKKATAPHAWLGSSGQDELQLSYLYWMVVKGRVGRQTQLREISVALRRNTYIEK